MPNDLGGPLELAFERFTENDPVELWRVVAICKHHTIEHEPVRLVHWYLSQEEAEQYAKSRCEKSDVFELFVTKYSKEPPHAD